MEPNVLNTVRDVVVVGYLFVIRVGVPVLILFMWGAALRKMLDKPPTEVALPSSTPKRVWDDLQVFNSVQSALRKVFVRH